MRQTLWDFFRPFSSVFIIPLVVILAVVAMIYPTVRVCVCVLEACVPAALVLDGFSSFFLSSFLPLRSLSTFDSPLKENSEGCRVKSTYNNENGQWDSRTAHGSRE